MIEKYVADANKAKAKEMLQQKKLHFILHAEFYSKVQQNILIKINHILHSEQIENKEKVAQELLQQFFKLLDNKYYLCMNKDIIIKLYINDGLLKYEFIKLYSMQEPKKQQERQSEKPEKKQSEEKKDQFSSMTVKQLIEYIEKKCQGKENPVKKNMRKPELLEIARKL